DLPVVARRKLLRQVDLDVVPTQGLTIAQNSRALPEAAFTAQQQYAKQPIDGPVQAVSLPPPVVKPVHPRPSGFSGTVPHAGAVAGGGAGLRSSHQRPLVTVAPAGAHSGAWFCPHGGGKGWHVELSVTNPGSAAVPVRITTFAKSGSAPPRRVVVPKASSIRI